MDIEKLIEQYQKASEYWRKNRTNFPDVAASYEAAATALSALQSENEELRGELEQVKRCIEIVENQRDQMKRERDAAIDCIYEIEDALDRGNDNDWAREHILEWESQKD